MWQEVLFRMGWGETCFRQSMYHWLRITNKLRLIISEAMAEEIFGSFAAIEHGKTSQYRVEQVSGI
jgi:hypothetical protein